MHPYIEEDVAVVYHCFGNARKYHMEGGDDEDEGGEGGEDGGGAAAGKEGNGKEGDDDEEEEEEEEEDATGRLEFDPDEAPALEMLLYSEDAAEAGVLVSKLPLESKKERSALVKKLVEARVLAVVSS